MPALQNIHVGIQAAVLCMFFFGMTGLLIDLLLLAFSVTRPPDWQRIPRNLLGRPWTERHAVLVALPPAIACMIGTSAMYVISNHGLLQAKGMPEMIGAFATFLLFHMPALVAIAALSRRMGISAGAGFGAGLRGLPRDFARGVVLGTAVLPVVWTGLAVSNQLLSRAGVEVDELQRIMRLMTETAGFPSWVQPALAAMAVLCAPVAEELLFRGVMLPALAKNIGAVRAMVLVSLLFALLHLHLPSLLPLFLLSMLFCAAYAYSGSITVPIVMHAVFNLVSIAALWFVRQ